MDGGTWPPTRCEPITRTDHELLLDGADDLIDGFFAAETSKAHGQHSPDRACPLPNARLLCYALGKMDAKNKLYFGDNLKILGEYVADASVDLIYLDPPFNSSATYNVLFKEKSGEESAAQITAFEDTWQWSREAEAVYRELVESGPHTAPDDLCANREVRQATFRLPFQRDGWHNLP